jgi:predicted esterase
MHRPGHRSLAGPHSRAGVAFLGLAAGCSPWPDAPLPILAGPGFFDRPFPDDRRTFDGHPDLSDFPHIDEISLVGDYAVEATNLDGFGLHSPLYIRFDRPFDTELLPSPTDSTRQGTGVFLVDIDPTSPDRGCQVPIVWDYQDSETRWQPERLLSIAPAWGRPLRPATQYALVFDRTIVARPDGFEAVWMPGHPDHNLYQPLHELLFEWRVSTEDIGYAVVFTTQDATAELAHIVNRQRTGLDEPEFPEQVEPWFAGDGYIAYAGRTRVPWWQHGEEPYVSNGGAFLFDDDWPILDHLDPVILGLSIPHGAMPEAGWPLVVFVHGTGSGWWTFADGTANDVAAPLAAAGIAAASISLPFHGERSVGGSEALMSFNVLNPTAGRTNLRQAAAEAVWMTDLFLSETRQTIGTNGTTIRFDPSRVAYMGHSHGAVMGSIALAYFDPRLRGVVLSGAGGGISLSAVGRDAGDIDIQGILEEVVGLAPNEELDTFHPIVGLLQMLGEASDPINYAAHWHHSEPRWSSGPHSVLMFEGTEDIYTPPVAIEALAAAGRIPVLDEQVSASGALALPGTPSGTTPTTRNTIAWDNTKVSSGLMQYEGGGHFVIFEEPTARDAYVHFLQTAMEGEPELKR